MDYISLVILGCAIVTFIPRLIPVLFIDKLDFPPKAEKFLNLIPYTVDWCSCSSRTCLEESSSWGYCNIDCSGADYCLFYSSILLMDDLMKLNITSPQLLKSKHYLIFYINKNYIHYFQYFTL